MFRKSYIERWRERFAFYLVIGIAAVIVILLVKYFWFSKTSCGHKIGLLWDLRHTISPESVPSVPPLRDIEEEKKAILKLIFIYQKPFKGKIFDGENSEKYSTRRQSAVVDLALRLIQQSGVPVQTYEVGRQAIEEKIFNGTFAEKRAYVSMILNAETRKKFGCLKKIGRGKFDVR